jgi:hypothetical protein
VLRLLGPRAMREAALAEIQELPERAALLAGLEADGLEELFARLKTERRWPEGMLG